MVKVGVNKDVTFFVFGTKQTKRNDIECHHKKCQKEERRIGRLATPNKFCTQITGGNNRPWWPSGLERVSNLSRH